MTLLELVLAMVVIAIVSATSLYFLYPLRQAVDVTVRAELTDIADNALQRIGREARLALPNSVRTASAGGAVFVELMPLRAAGRYRGDSGDVATGVDCAGGVADNTLVFDVADACFKSIGTVQGAAGITANDFVVLNNYGDGFAGQDVYATAGTLNRSRVAAVSPDPAAVPVRHRIQMASVQFQRSLHESPGQRFFVVAGNAAGPEPVTFHCDPAAGILVRRWGYALSAAQATAFAAGNSAILAENVTACSFDYSPNAAPHMGLLTLRLTLAKALSGGGTESVTLYHAVHVSNLP